MWVSRASEFGDPSGQEVIEAFISSSVLDKNMVPSKKNNRADIEHRYHRPTGGIFVSEKCNGGFHRIVTYYVLASGNDPDKIIARDKQALKESRLKKQKDCPSASDKQIVQ
jgi:hypothetical protein